MKYSKKSIAVFGTSKGASKTKVYHGSNYSGIKEIDTDRTREDIRDYNEGPGFYITKDKDVAREYGKCVYELEVENVVDFNIEDNVDKYLNNVREELSNEYPTEIPNSIDFITIKEMLMNSSLSFYFLYEEIFLYIDSIDNDFINNMEPDILFDKVKNICLEALPKSYLYYSNQISSVGIIKSEKVVISLKQIH